MWKYTAADAAKSIALTSAVCAVALWYVLTYQAPLLTRLLHTAVAIFGN